MARIEKSIDVNVPLQAVYIQLTEFEEYPSFMDRIEEVRLTDDRHLHWRAKKNGNDIEWDSELTALVPDRSLSWLNLNGPRNSGRVELEPLDADHTRVRLTMECEQRDGHEGVGMTADMIGNVGRRVEEDMARFKKFVERLPHRVAIMDNSLSGAEPIGSGSFGEVGEIPPAAQPAGSTAGKAVGQGEQERRDTHESAGHAYQSAYQGTYQGGAAGDEAAAGARRSGAEGGRGGARGERSGRPPWLPHLLQAWEEPLSRVRKMSEEVDEIAQRYIRRPLYGSRARQGGIGPAWTPAVEVSKQGDEFVVCAEVPGVKREDVQIEIRSTRLTIEGDRRQPPEPRPEFRRSERSYGHFYRVIELPEGAEEEGVRASMQDGLLEIRVPLAKEGQTGRRVDIG